MTGIRDWSVRLAHEVAPEEADLAPLWAEAFVAGGRERDDLRAAGGSAVGGFGAEGIAAVMPVVFQALAASAGVVMSALASRHAGDFLGCVKNGLALLELRGRAEKAAGKPKDAEADPPGVPGEATYEPLRRVIRAMGHELRASGMDDDRSDIITFRVLRTLLEEPQGAEGFVQEVAAAR